MLFTPKSHSDLSATTFSTSHRNSQQILLLKTINEHAHTEKPTYIYPYNTIDVVHIIVCGDTKTHPKIQPCNFYGAV